MSIKPAVLDVDPVVRLGAYGSNMSVGPILGVDVINLNVDPNMVRVTDATGFTKIIQAEGNIVTLPENKFSGDISIEYVVDSCENIYSSLNNAFTVERRTYKASPSERRKKKLQKAAKRKQRK